MSKEKDYCLACENEVEKNEPYCEVCTEIMIQAEINSERGEHDD